MSSNVFPSQSCQDESIQTDKASMPLEFSSMCAENKMGIVSTPSKWVQTILFYTLELKWNTREYFNGILLIILKL